MDRRDYLKMILILNISKERLHYYEFVRPIEAIVRDLNVPYENKHYLNLSLSQIKDFERIIICGTSLYDNEFLNNVDRFLWIRDCDKPILGICAGMQIISKIFGGKIRKKTEIGFFKEKFNKDFLGLNGEVEVYHLHNNYATTPEDFYIFSISSNLVPQAIKHKELPIFCTLFHPEVRQKELIKNFCLINYRH
ncbi:MAG: hypothetical protein QXJ28_02255 [Candidatus Pacearchaeota archaeon]